MLGALQRLVESKHCGTCGRLKDSSDLSTGGIYLKSSRIQSAAKRGCRACDFRHRVIRSLDLQNIRVDFTESGMYMIDPEVIWFEFFRVRNGVRSSEYPELAFRHLLSRETSSESTFARIRGWLDNCTSNHARCQKAGGPPHFMPKRLLSLAQDRVVLREDAQPDRYACLSHCWGKDNPPTRTLKSTIEDHKKDIPLSTLSKTFRDAIDICRRLSVGYLWIDSLCIIQDSDEHWNEEAVKMGDIYANAHFTIAASSSKDGSGGCYKDRHPDYVDCGIVDEGSVYARRTTPGSLYGNRAPDEVAVFDLPLLGRAWAFQEILLSARVLHFKREEVIWQCNECQWSESGSHDLKHNPTPGRTLVTGTKFSEATWHKLIEEYSGLQLTFEKDRLPALAAISQRVSSYTNDRFLAGLWMNTLLRDLAWRVAPLYTDRDSEDKRSTERNVPSWSWISTLIRKYWNSPRDERFECARVVAVNVEEIGSPYLGKYSRAELVLDEPVFRTTLRGIENFKHKGLSSDGWFPDYKFTINGPFYGRGKSQVVLLLLSGKWEWPITALVLRLREDGKTYERIGLLLMRLDLDRYLTVVEGIGQEQAASYLAQFPREELIIT